MIFTEEQIAIHNFINNEEKDCLISALAGSSKSTTILTAIQKDGKTKPKFKNALLLAFAKANEQDFRKKLGLPLDGKTSPVIKTVNALGYFSIMRKLPKTTVDNRKLYEACKRVSVPRDNQEEVLKEVRALRMEGYVPLDNKIAKRRNTNPDLVATNEYTDAVINESINMAFRGMVDFDDQIYIPSTCFDNTYMSQVIKSICGDNTITFVDEAQDMSYLNIMFLKLLNPKRIVCVGDPNQSIYGFRGAKDNAMEELLEGREYATFTLSQSFRVPKVLTARYRYTIPNFTSHHSLGMGQFISHENAWSGKSLPLKSCFISRNNAPLIEMARKVNREGFSVSIRGGLEEPKILIKYIKDIIARGIDDEMNYELINEWANFRARRKGANLDNIAEDKENIEKLYQSILSDNLAPTETNLVKLVETLFSTNVKNPDFIFMTGHKSKGLEFNSVVHLDSFLINRYNTPSKDLFKYKQDENLRYVIETRAKDTLILLSSKNYNEGISTKLCTL